MTLAILGGEPLSRAPWPTWPRASPRTLGLVHEALASGKWTVSGQALVPARFDRLIGERWAEYLGVRHALPCSSGTAGLGMALEACGIGPGDEVVVPGMTWVACAQSVYNVGAVPVAVDVDPCTLSLDPAAVEAALSPRTRAIIAVHAYCGLADLDALDAIARPRGLVLIEDASQAHGAMWRGKRVGGFGAISVFSTQQSKLLTSGEGGLVATDDADLYLRLQYLRMDGRRLSDRVSPDNWMSIEGAGEVQGRNLMLPEFSCALLVGGLAELDGLNDRRGEAISALDRALAEVGGVAVTGAGRGTTRRTAWRLTLRLDADAFGGVPAPLVGRAVTAELGLPIEPVDTPLCRNPLYRPLSVPRVARRQDAAAFDPRRFDLPVAEAQHRRILAMPHFGLLAEHGSMGRVAAAFSKVKAGADALRAAMERGQVGMAAPQR